MKWTGVAGTGIVVLLLAQSAAEVAAAEAYTMTPVEGAAPYLQTIRAPEAWRHLKDKPLVRNITLGVIDRGFQGMRKGATDFAGRLHRVPRTAGRERHGTVAAAIAAASGNTAAASNVGINWTSGLELGLGRTTAEFARSFQDMLDRGVNVFSVSLGSSGSSGAGNGVCEQGEAEREFEFINELALLIDRANARAPGGSARFIVVVAAGNDGCELGSGAPGRKKPVNLLVAGGALEGAAATGSNRGPLIDIAAPYVVQRLYSYDEGKFSDYAGTSYSAPQAAGVAALVWAFVPELETPVQVVERLKRTAAGAIPEFGGAGVIDAYAALTGVKGRPNETKKKQRPPRARENMRVY